MLTGIGDKMARPSEKSEKVLAQEHKERTAHYVDNTVHWMEKLSKAMRSKTYPTTPQEKAKALAYIDTEYKAFQASFTADAKPVDKGFKF